MKTRTALLAMVLCASSLFADQQDALRIGDIRKVMQQMLSQHVEKKQLTPEVIRGSFKNYIDQIDPYRMYLMENEVKPYINLTDAQVTAIIDQYQRNDFSMYTKLNTTIQHAIERARKYRKTLEQTQQSEIFSPEHTLKEEWRNTGPQHPFAVNDAELQARIKFDLLQYIQYQKKRFGATSVDKYRKHTLAMYENDMHRNEDDYMLVDQGGKAIPKDKQESLFAMHVLKSLANGLDAHSKFFNRNEAYDMKVRLEKGFQGVGIELKEHPEGIIISGLVKNGPAEKSGKVQVNDLIVAVDGHDISDDSLEEVLALLHGSNGTSTVISLKHALDEKATKRGTIVQVNLKRESIAVDQGRVETSYEAFGDGIIGRVALHSFYQGEGIINSENDVREAITKLNKVGNLKGLILDLRDNTGGFLMQAVKVVGLFITKGVVVISKYSNGEEHFYRDMDGKQSYDGPLIVLTSRETASAAEIVAQALQDYGVALIVGDEQTFGKGTIQSQTVTGNEGSSFFKVTVGKYYTVSGKTPQNQGVKADILVPSSISRERIGEEYLEDTVAADTIPATFNDTLADIEPGLKPWYMHYYTPVLQQKKSFWRDMLPVLKKNSANRIAHNKEYQLFIKNSDPRQLETEASDGVDKPTDNLAEDAKGDLQLAEAINVVKDMIQLQIKARSMDQLQSK